MPAKNQPFPFLSSLLTASMIALAPASSWGADELSPDERRLEEVRQLILGHEAFIRQCIRRVRDRNMSPEAKAFLDDLDPKKDGFLERFRAADEYLTAAEEKARQACELMYDGINVCEREDGRGALLAIERLTADVADANELLRDPLTRADELEATASAKESLEA